jgi:protein involved in polysaccharide export with SLBB domain
MSNSRALGTLFISLSLVAQESGTPDQQALRQLAGVASPQQAQALADSVTSRKAPSLQQEPTQDAQREQQANLARFQAEIKAAKARENAPARFAEDLFKFRQAPLSSTEGGIADDYVLGVGDQVQVNTFGSATFEVPAQVDGKGELVVPKVGSIKVAGMSLARARAAVQAKVAQQFSRTSVDISVIKLREIRVFVLGEVYRPGSYLVPSLTSLVNVLSLSGGPTAAGSYRQIRVLRGGKVIHQVDLYPLRAEGLGNMNFPLQSGDTLFVPLAFNQVLLEGAFSRVVTATGELLPREKNPRQTKEIEVLKLQIAQEEARLLPKTHPTLAQGEDKDNLTTSRSIPIQGLTPMDLAQASQELNAVERTSIQDRIKMLQTRLERLVEPERGDKRLQIDPENVGRPSGNSLENAGQPEWLVRWQSEGKVPTMQFEMLPTETVADALHFAGGLAIQAFEGNLSLRRVGAGGALEGMDVPLQRASQVELKRGDVLSAMGRRDSQGKVVTLTGWARVRGLFAREDGLRVGDLLKKEAQVLPDTYLHRGEITRTLPDMTTRFLAFDVAQAMAGTPEHNLLLEDRDRIELYRTTDIRLPETVQVLGPVSRPGTFPFHEGMRASDLLFQAGVLLNEADRFVAELAHTGNGKPSQIIQLDLGKLLSSDQGSPVQLIEEAINPLLKPLDQLSIYAKPDYRPHQTVTLLGQVARPGVYVLDSPHTGLREVLARAGGLTADAMPQGSIFLRPMTNPNPGEFQPEDIQKTGAKAPALNGINSILERLNETKRQPTTGALLKTPILHGLGAGSLDRLVVNIPAILAGNNSYDVDLQDGDSIIVPRRSDAAYVVGETASPFMTYKVTPGLKVRELVKIAGGLTRNADDSNLRLLKADGRILDRSIMGQEVEPGDAVLVPQRIRRDSTWQENLSALTPIALILNAIK